MSSRIKGAAFDARSIARKTIRSYRREKVLYGNPCSLISFPFLYIHDQIRYKQLGKYISLARRIPSWTRGEEAVALAQASYALPGDPIIVEIGSFLGCSTILLAGARKLLKAGQIHCVDPFDASGDSFSTTVYQKIMSQKRSSLRWRFDKNVERAGLREYVTVHQGNADQVAQEWNCPIDMIFLDGDQSYEGVQTAYQSWFPFLKHNGVIAIHNSGRGVHVEGHDGHARLVIETIREPQFGDIRLIGTTTFARKLST